MKNERTFVAIKPDGIQRSLIGEVITRLERTGLKFVAFKFVVPTEDQCWKHYNKNDEWYESKGAKIVETRQAAGKVVDKPAIEYGKDIVKQLVQFMTSGPILAMVLEGNAAVGIVKKIVGGTEPMTSDVGTIRGDFTIDSYDLASYDERAVRNLIHCSDKVEEAQREIDLWFQPNELVNYRHVQERILYDTDLNGTIVK
jgi:nucleoside-diphosphate kinase